MAWFANIVVTVGLGALAAWHLDVARLFNVLQPIVVCLSIMVAAVFVRLNRGMPTLDWKSLTGDERKGLTARIVELTKEYVQIVALNTITLICVLTLSALGKADAVLLDHLYQQAIAGAFAFLMTLCVLRMAYVVWRDFDIVRLQKNLLDKAADRDADEANKKLSDEKLSKMKAANLQAPQMTRAGTL